MSAIEVDAAFHLVEKVKNSSDNSLARAVNDLPLLLSPIASMLKLFGGITYPFYLNDFQVL